MPLPPGLDGYFATRGFLNNEESKKLQQSAAQIGILSKLQTEQRVRQNEQEIRGALAKGDIEGLMRLPGGPDIASKILGVQNAGIKGQLDSARIAQIASESEKRQREADVATRQGQAQGALANLFTPSGSYGQGTDQDRPNAQVFPNDAAAIAAMQDAERRGLPFTGNVPNPGNVQALSVAADPKAAIPALIRAQASTAITPYQTENLRLQTQRLNQGQQRIDNPRPQAMHFVPGTDSEGNQTVSVFSPKGEMVKGAIPTGALTPSWQNNSNVRERQLATSLDMIIRPHQSVLDGYQKYERIRASGDSSQANQYLAQQLMTMSKSGQRALPKAELERVLGTTFEGGDWLQRASNYVSQIAAGTRTADTDAKLNALADAMALAAAQRIGQEFQNTRARTPSGVDPDRIIGGQPRIYGRYIITPTGKVFAGKDSADAQAKLDAMLKAGGQ